MKIWFCSDSHFGHDKPFIWKSRGFNSIQEHDETIIKNWNSIVDIEDEVYFLGDIMLHDNEYGIKFLSQLNGKIHIILGNHDTNFRIPLYQSCPNVVSVNWALRIKYKKYIFWLSHFPTQIGDFYDNKKIWCLCGHRHTKDKFIDIDKKCYHVELDAHNNCPIEIEEIIHDIQEKKKLLDKE